MGSGISRLWFRRTAAGATDGPWPRVEPDEVAGVFRVSDPRVFQAGRADFCRRWLGAAVLHPGLRKARVDLATATALIEFEPGAASTAEMAAAFAGAVREALAARADDANGQADWIALTAFPGPDSRVWEVSGRSSKRFCLRHPGFGADRRAVSVERLTRANGVTGCRAGWFSDTLTVAFDPALTDEARILDAVERNRRESGRAEPVTSLACAEGSVALGRLERFANLAKAGGAFGLTLVALAVPGMPTFPFLLATSYYLARSSPRLDRALLDSAFFGPILRDWETHRGLSPPSKGRLIGLTAAILAVTVVVTPMSPVVLILILLMFLVSFYGIIGLPGIPAREGEGLRQAATLALAPA